MGPPAACRPQRRLDEIPAMNALQSRHVAAKNRVWSTNKQLVNYRYLVFGRPCGRPRYSSATSRVQPVGLGCADTYIILPELILRALPWSIDARNGRPRHSSATSPSCPQPRWGVCVKSHARSFPARSLHESCHLVYRRPRRPAQKQLRHLPRVAHGGGAKAQPVGRRGVHRRRRKRRRSQRQHDVVAAMPAPPPWQDVKRTASSSSNCSSTKLACISKVFCRAGNVRALQAFRPFIRRILT